MSQQNSDVLLIGAAAVCFYLYSKRNQAVAVANRARVATMPGSAGTGMQQIGMAALTGFLKSIAAPGVTQNNSAQSYVPSLTSAANLSTDYYQSGTVQDVVPDWGGFDFGDIA